MPQLFRSPRPFPAPLEPSPPFDPTSMPPPQALPLLAAVKKMRPPFLYAVDPVDRAWGMAMIGLHILICILLPLSIWPFDSVSFAEEARIWMWLYLCFFAAMVVIMCVDILYDPLLLPPPPPEMDMC